MPSFTIATTDDATERGDGSDFSSSGVEVNVNSSTTANGRRNAGFYFPGVTLARGDVVGTVTLRIFGNDPSADDMQCDIFCNAVDNANNFTVEADVTSRSLTTRSVEWISLDTGGGFFESSDFGTVLQEVVNRPGWASGNAVVVILRGQNASGAETYNIKAIESATTFEADLQVNYTPGLDTIVDGGEPVLLGQPTYAGAGLWGPYWSDTNTGLIVHLDQDGVTTGSVKMARTTNGGVAWTVSDITTSATVSLCAFYEKELGTTGATLLHIWWLQATDTVVKYATVNIATGVVSSIVTVVTAAAASTASVQHSQSWGCILRNGNLLCGGAGETLGTYTLYCYRSTDGGANWTARAEGHEQSGDSGYLYPGNTDDCGDACLVYYDSSVVELSVKMYDDSANTWTETAIGACDLTFDLIQENHFHGALDCTTGAIRLASWDGVDAALTGDLRTWTIIPNSIVSPSITAGANAITNVANANGACAVAVNHQNGDIYVAYCRGSLWSERVTVYYKVSTNGLVSFGSEMSYSQSQQALGEWDFRRIGSPRVISASGGKIQWSFFDDENYFIYVNLNNDVEIGAGDTACQDQVGGGCYGVTTPPGPGGEALSQGGWRYVIPPPKRIPWVSPPRAVSPGNRRRPPR